MSSDKPPRPAASLRVIEAYNKDAGRNIARVSYGTMEALGVSIGQVIEVKGKDRSTATLCMPLDPADDEGGSSNIVRLDALTRANATAGMRDTVVVKLAQALPAGRLVLAPQQETPPIDDRYIASALEGVPVTADDLVMVPYFGGKLIFKVVEVAAAAAEEGRPQQQGQGAPLPIEAFVINAGTNAAVKRQRRGRIRSYFSEYVRQEEEEAGAAKASSAGSLYRGSGGAPFYLGIRMELFIGAIAERIDFQKRMAPAAGKPEVQAEGMMRLAARYLDIARAEIEETESRIGQDSKLYAAVVQAEKSYPSSALIDDEAELRRLLQGLKYRIAAKWAGAEAG